MILEGMVWGVFIPGMRRISRFLCPIASSTSCQKLESAVGGGGEREPGVMFRVFLSRVNFLISLGTSRIEDKG